MITFGFVGSYFGGALLYAAVAATASLIAAALFGVRPSVWRGGLALAIWLVIFLGLHPFPNPSTLDCSDGGPAIIVQPFGFLDGYFLFWRQGRPIGDWLSSLRIVSPVMNLVFFAPIGLALASQTRRWSIAAVTGLSVSSFIELAQITALFGIYPCRYRHFEVDDLILNTAGVLLGFAFARRTIVRHEA